MDMSELTCEHFPLQKMKKGSSLKFTENFYVIQFEDGIALVPNNWLRISEDQQQQFCFYPNYEVKKRLNKAIQSKEIPDVKNVQAGWVMYDVLRVFASADTFKRGQEKLKMAENTSDINTEDEENMKQTRHDRAAAKYFTSDDESSGTEVESNLLSPLPDSREFSRPQKLFSSKRPAQILATYEHPIISEEVKNKIATEKKQSKIFLQETEVIAKHKKQKLEDKNQNQSSQESINEENDYSIDEYNTKLTTHQNTNNEDSQKVLKEILKKVNRILIEMTYIERRLSRIEDKANYTNQEININTVKAFAFDTISSIEELELFEQNLKNAEFFMKMRNFLKLKGGTNIQDTIKNIFKTLIKDEILMLYSWKGARGKTAFRSFKIVDLIIAVVRLYDANTTEEIITKLMISWIVQAPARVRRIADKENKQKNKTNGVLDQDNQDLQE